jgi:hypothetical protein
MNDFWSFLGAGKAGTMKPTEICETRLEVGPGRIPGLAGWLLGKLRRESAPGPRLVLRERITLAPRQTLALIEAEGRRFLVATSPEGAPAFYALDEHGRGRVVSRASATSSARVSW